MADNKHNCKEWLRSSLSKYVRSATKYDINIEFGYFSSLKFYNKLV